MNAQQLVAGPAEVRSQAAQRFKSPNQSQCGASAIRSVGPLQGTHGHAGPVLAELGALAKTVEETARRTHGGSGSGTIEYQQISAHRLI